MIQCLYMSFFGKHQGLVSRFRGSEKKIVQNLTPKTKKFPMTLFTNFDILLTVFLSITLANDQLYAQFLYFIILLLQSSTSFEQRRIHHQVVIFY